ncbi:Coenzyme gamma-F420-2:alpha-L-glutamate ligase [uncultured archaeon]|nr:Coenzyme gamma-F420-2:alpha-L-glutamate ligase [uncultured archaeon]
MKRVVMGYIFCDRKPGKDEEIFLREAEKRNIDLVMFNLCKKFNEKEIEKKAKKCKIIFNNSAEDYAPEFVKTLEELGKKVVDSSRASYYNEDKWMFYLECEKNKIPTPKTILLPEDLNAAKQELREFGHWPVILKRIFGTQGEFVDKAESPEHAEKIIEKFWKKGSERAPIIAQELIRSPCYRITTIDKKIVQTALKTSNGWKSTGVYAKKIKRFRVGKKLEKMVNKILDTVHIKVCGIDLLKKNNKWYVLEVNSTPAFDFFEEEREMLIGKVLDLLLKEVQ